MLKNKIIAIGFVALFGPFVFWASQSANSQVEQKIRNVENGLIEFKPGSPAENAPAPKKMALSERMAFYKVPGVSIAVIHDHKIEWSKGYGVLKAGSSTPVTPDTFFQAASTSKLITAAIALHFVGKRKLDLDRDVNSYLKSWKIPENDLTKNKKVTLRLLLSHQAGLPTTNFDHDEKVGYPTLVQVVKGESPAKNKAAVVEFVPGSKWQYSNVGYDVIQLVLEDVLDKPFAQIAQEIVFKPLGMKSSTFAYPLKPELLAKEAMPHDDKGIAREPAMHLTALAHGGLMTTPSDLARFTIELMLAYQGKSSRILSQEMARQLLNKELDLDPKMTAGFPLGEGLGVFLRGQADQFSFLHPGGNLPGTNCWLEGWPGSGKGVVIMANGAGGEVLAIEILQAVINEYQGPIPTKISHP